MIIDYKTTTEKINHHVAQVNFYKQAVKQIAGCEDVAGYIVYLHKDVVDFVKT